MWQKRSFLTARTKARPQRARRAVVKNSALKKYRVRPASVAEQSSSLSARGASRRLCERPSRKPSRFHPALASTSPPQKKRRSSSSNGQKATTAVLECASPSEKLPVLSPRAESGCKRGASNAGWENDASGPERAAALERSQAEAHNLKQG